MKPTTMLNLTHVGKEGLGEELKNIDIEEMIGKLPEQIEVFHMKHHNAAVIGSSDLASLLIISCLYHRPIEAVGGLVTAQMSRPAELADLKQLIEIELVSNTRFLDLPIIEERKVAPWPKDSLLVKRRMVNSKGFRRKGINPGRR